MDTCLNTVRVLSTALLASAGFGVAAQAQIQQDTLIVGVNSSSTDSFRIINAGPGADPGVTVDGGVQSTTPWSKSYIQSVEFDNADDISHNEAGNFLGANFGNSYTGFELFNFATDGTSAFQSIWGIKTQTGGSRTDRGGGLSVSPDNTMVAWANYDAGSIQVLEYNAGSAVGTGTGASVTGWLETSTGNGNGGAGSLTALSTGSTQATAWLDNDTVLGLNSFGELISLDLSSASFGSPSSPTTTNTWTIEATGGFVNGNSQFTGLVYNEQIAPGIIIGSSGRYSGGASTTEIVVWDADTFAVLDRVDISVSTDDGGSQATGREIALDSEGNLYIGGFGENIVSVIDDFVNNVGSVADNTSVYWFNNNFFASYSGLDVASSMAMSSLLLGDFDGDDDVDGQDFTIWQTSFPTTSGATLGDGDADGDGDVDGQDFTIWQTNFPSQLSVMQATYATSMSESAQLVTLVPEPASVVLLTLGGLATVTRRRHAA